MKPPVPTNPVATTPDPGMPDRTPPDPAASAGGLRGPEQQGGGAAPPSRERGDTPGGAPAAGQSMDLSEPGRQSAAAWSEPRQAGDPPQPASAHAAPGPTAAPLPAPLVAVQRAPGADPDLPLPAYATPGAAGADLRADLRGGSLDLPPGARAAVPTGLVLALPEGFEGQVRPRSGLALRDGVTVANAPGTVDADFRGEVQVLLVNLGTTPVRIGHGERIAQLVVAPVVQARFALAPALPPTARGAGGFGSTGRG